MHVGTQDDDWLRQMYYMQTHTHTQTYTHAHKSRETIVSVCSESMKGVGRLHRPALSPVTMFPRWMKGAQSWAAGQRQRGVSLCYVITPLC